MKLFFFKPDAFDPLLIIVSKLSSLDEYSKLEALTNEIFQILIEQDEATQSNILIFSIIKDYEKTTENLILPSIYSSQTLTNRCHQNTNFLNSIIIQTLTKYDCKFYIELTDSKILLHTIKLSLMPLSKYYSLKIE